MDCRLARLAEVLLRAAPALAEVDSRPSRVLAGFSLSILQLLNVYM